MVDQLSSFADEVTRVAREVGTEGVLGGQAEVKGVSGTWRDLTESVNGMASNLTDQVRQIANVTTAVANGDLTQKVTVEARGEVAALADTINSMTETLRTFADQVTGVAREVGTEGVLGGQADVPGAAGTWKDLTDSVNSMATNLTDQVRQIANVTTAVANGDLTQKVTVEAKGEVAALADTINSMTETLRTFADQVTGVAREVGTEGVLGGQADVPGAAGTWKDLTESVNFMATNLTDQVRQIANVTTAVANGDLTQKVTVEARGEILELKRTINTMVDQLSSFADEVTRVAKRGGHRGRPRRPGRRQGRLRHVARPDRVGERHGVQPDRPGAPDRQRDDRGRQRRPVAEGHGRGRAARSRRSPTPSTGWSTGCRASPTRSPASRARWAPRACSAARPRSRASPARGATSPSR